jgi:circadian clock protein KaiB
MSINAESNIPVEKDPRTLLEETLAKCNSEKYILSLYISGMTVRSTRAIENIRQICEENLKNRYELEIIDIFKNPEKAKNEQLVAAPTLIKRLPLPLRKFIGDLSDTEKMLIGLKIKS